jgi:hypothetical protein
MSQFAAPEALKFNVIAGIERERREPIEVIGKRDRCPGRPDTVTDAFYLRKSAFICG